MQTKKPERQTCNGLPFSGAIGAASGAWTLIPQINLLLRQDPLFNWVQYSTE